MTNELKNFIKEDEKEFEEKFEHSKTCQSYKRLGEDEYYCMLKNIKDWHKQRQISLIKMIVGDLESNPNEDGSISPNIMHWVEKKQSQLRKLYQLTDGK